jgi:undecaprenyl-diphosphatase
MYIHHIIILAIVQGITEFLPVSSSGHLYLTHIILGDGTAVNSWGAGLTIDVAMHVGTLFSVLIYFRKDLSKIFAAFIKADGQKNSSRDMKLGIQVLIASLPVIAMGLTLEILEPQWLRSMTVIAWTTLLFGIVLWIADRYFSTEKYLDKMNYAHAFWIGIAQMLALVPGVSRSGITMTAGRFLGFNRTDSARFSLLLAIVAISGAGILRSWDLFKSGNLVLGLDSLTAAVLAFASGWVAISLMMRWLSKATFKPFAVYRILLGIMLLVLGSTG